MEKDGILNIKSRGEWRRWLENNFNTKKEVWLVYAKKQLVSNAFSTMMQLKKPFVSAG